MTDGEFLNEVAEWLSAEACEAYADGRQKACQLMLVRAERLREIAERMLKDEKYPEVRP